MSYYYNGTIEEVLGQLHTRELMRWQKKAYKIDEWYYPTDNSYSVHYTLDEIKTELETREHITNKQEGKILRREAAKRKT